MVFGSDIYGATLPYGGDPHALAETANCGLCGENWRIEATDLSTGRVKAVLHPVTINWEEVYSAPGTGSIIIPTRGTAAEDVWPHTTGIYVSRVVNDGSKWKRVGHFGGYVEKVSASSGGATTLGLQSIDRYLFHRLIADDNGGLEYSTPGYVSSDNPGDGIAQTEIAKQLVDLATPRGVPLIPVAGVSNQIRVRHWDPWEFKNIGEAIQQLSEVINGVKYRLEHEFIEGFGIWKTYINFFDEESVDRNVVLRSDYEAWKYGLEIDARNQASRVYGVGTGEGATQMFSVAYDADADKPEFQKTIAWKDVSVPETLDDHTRGAVTEYRDPATTPNTTLAGLQRVPPEILLVGDIVSAEIGYGLATYRGEKARVSSIAWNLTSGEPVTRGVGLLPIIRPSLSVKTQTPAIAPPPETPEEGSSPTPETPITPPTPDLPSQVIDLSIWKLTLPTGSSGKPDEIKQPALASYSNSELFHTVEGPGVLFKAPQDGVTTPNSKNTRTELREMKPGGTSNASWSSGTMEAELAFTHLPASKPHVVGMQIHDSSDDVSVLRLEGTDLWTTNGDNTHGTKIMTNYQLGTRIKVRAEASGGKITWFLNGNQVAQLSKKVSGGYFKAGAYQQAGNSGPDYGEVIIYSLTVTH